MGRAAIAASDVHYDKGNGAEGKGTANEDMMAMGHHIIPVPLGIQLYQFDIVYIYCPPCSCLLIPDSFIPICASLAIVTRKKKAALPLVVRANLAVVADKLRAANYLADGEETQ